MSEIVQNLLTALQTAKIFGCSPQLVYRLAAEGKLPAVRLAKRTVRFRPGDVETYIQANCRSIAQRKEGPDETPRK